MNRCSYCGENLEVYGPMTVSPDVQTRSVTIDVRGLPRPQGSLKMHALPNGKVAARYPAAVWAWRAQVQQAAAATKTEQFAGPVELRLGFDLPRPVGHFGTGRNAGSVKRSAPLWPGVAPDLDKLIRCVSDALTDAGIWHDDGQVCSIVAAKRYAAQPGVHITVKEMA